MLKNFFLGLNESSAKKFLAKHSKRPGSKYSLSDLNGLYSRLKPIANRADFSIVKSFGSLKVFEGSSHQSQQNIGVIIETRESKSLEKVVLNFVKASGLSVQLFCGLSNKEFILKSRISELIEHGKLTLNVLPVTELTLAQYNAILLSEAFWLELLGQDKVVIFQSDSWCCSESRYRVSDFFHFDYIGSTWPRKRPIGLTVDGGSGGLSIRDWKLSLEALKSFEAEKWPGGEDAFFAFHIELLGGKVATMSEAGKFSTQSFFSDKSLGAHQISLLSKTEQDRFLAYCPEAKFLLE